jgi:voltage-gated potassium channel
MERIKKAIACFICVVAAGIIGFVLIEQLSLTDAVYFTIATIATVGYGDIVPVKGGRQRSRV